MTKYSWVAIAMWSGPPSWVINESLCCTVVEKDSVTGLIGMRYGVVMLSVGLDAVPGTHLVFALHGRPELIQG